MTKLHEILPVETDLKTRALQALAGLKSILSAPSRFQGMIRTYQPLDQAGEKLSPESIVLSTTVEEELASNLRPFINFVDITIQKEMTNRGTSADVIVDGKVLFKDLSAPALLNLESRLAELRAVYALIPTLDPLRRWTADSEQGQGRWSSEVETTFRTKKVPQVIEKSPATDRHPAQVELYSDDVRVGTWSTEHLSGMMSAADKRLRLERLDTLISAVKQARSRANEAEVTPVKVAETILSYIDGR